MPNIALLIPAGYNESLPQEIHARDFFNVIQGPKPPAYIGIPIVTMPLIDHFHCHNPADTISTIPESTAFPTPGVLKRNPLPYTLLSHHSDRFQKVNINGFLPTLRSYQRSVSGHCPRSTSISVIY